MKSRATETEKEGIREYVFLAHCGMDNPGAEVLETIGQYDMQFSRIVSQFKKMLHTTSAREILERHQNITYVEFMELWSEASGKILQKKKG